MKYSELFVFIIFAFVVSCVTPEEDAKKEKIITKPVKTVEVPVFNADSAYHYVKQQVLFGPRVPNTKAHAECIKFLENKLKEFTPHVILQKTRVRAYDGTTLNITNIIASFKPETNNRILLCAHWDSRPIAEKDPDPALRNKPIDGANDGASGVGVLLEIARIISQKEPSIGIDIIFFDAEDYGQPHDSNLPPMEDTWALGSQYWSRNPHKENYFAKYGILLDMVGAHDATFLKEGFSVQFASSIVNKVWSTAHRLGYQNYFIDKNTNAITDDHYYINVITGIPTIDIIHHESTTSTGFFEFWHTHKDNMDNISKETLKAVGQTVLTVIYEEN